MALEFGNREQIKYKKASLFDFMIDSAGDLHKDAVVAERKQLETLIVKMKRGQVLNGPEQKTYKELSQKFVEIAEKQFGSRVTSYRKIADYFDVHVQTVKAWAKKGMPKAGRHNYDLVEIRKWLIDRGLSTDSGGNGGEPPGPDSSDDFGRRYQRERYLHEKMKRKERELKVEELLGSLVPLDQISSEFSAMCGAVKMDLLALPHKLSPFLEGLKAVEIQKRLQSAIDDVLRHLSREKNA